MTEQNKCSIGGAMSLQRVMTSEQSEEITMLRKEVERLERASATQEELDPLEPEDKSAQVAYVFDAIADRTKLKEFSRFVTDEYEAFEDNSSEDEPQVIYTFKAFRDQYELAEFQRGPDYGQAINTFGRWLRAQHRYASDAMHRKAYDMLDEIYKQWCTTLSDHDVGPE